VNVQQGMPTKGSTRKRKPRARRRRAVARPGGGAILHPDLVIGGLSEILQGVAHPVANTLADVGTYVGRPLEELFPAPAAVPAVTVTRRWRVGGVLSEDIAFRSLHVPLDPKFQRRYLRSYRETRRVYARRIRPAAARGRPRLLYLHGYMQPETVVEELAVLTTMALQLNVEIIQMQPPYHGRRAPRASRFSGEFYWTADLVRSFEALRQTLLDARTLLGWLLAEDARPVGVAGLSLGGALTLSLACLEERFAFAVPIVAHMDLAALVSDAPVLTKMRHDLKAFGWRKKQFDEFVRGVGWYELRPKLPASRVLMIAASEDRFFDPRRVRRLWRRWGKPEIHWYPTSHMGFLTHLPEVLGVMRKFIDRPAGHRVDAARSIRPTAVWPSRRARPG
jgi:pimeloyl-ACP methyl ester carboxylesterase